MKDTCKGKAVNPTTGVHLRSRDLITQEEHTGVTLLTGLSWGVCAVPQPALAAGQRCCLFPILAAAGGQRSDL